MRKTLFAFCITFLAAGFAFSAASAQSHAPVPVEVFFAGPDQALSDESLAALDAASRLTPDQQDPDKLVKAPAPGLTQLVVSMVASSKTNMQWEPIRPGQVGTVNDHGGLQLRVITDELGYGSNPVARMLGALLPRSANYDTKPICRDWRGSLVTPCSAGQIIVGFRKYWKLDGQQSGNFTYQNTSTNYPFNTLSTRINIR